MAYVVDRVVICDAFREPDKHYQILRGGKETPPDVHVRPVVGGHPEAIMTLEEFRKESPLLRTAFLMKLADLQGNATLAYELVQNADDAPGATWLRFDVREDALVVDNDGIFSTCGRLEDDDCTWAAGDITRKRLCDFHRFCLVGSGNKRVEQDTIGAFGIGFTAVYQLTDHPELISAGQHWILDELQPPERRIRVCDGCPSCLDPRLPGTRFILPWAGDALSPLRTALAAQVVTPSDIESLRAALLHDLPPSMLFLRKLARLEVLRDGSRELMLERVVDGDSLIVSDGEDDRVWHLLRGDFNHPADELRRRYPAKITQGADITFRPDVNVSIATGNGRFSAVDQWPVLGVHRGMSTASRSHFLLRAIAWAYLGPAIALGGLAVCVFGFGALAVAVRLVLVLFKQAGV